LDISEVSTKRASLEGTEAGGRGRRASSSSGKASSGDAIRGGFASAAVTDAVEEAVAVATVVAATAGDENVELRKLEKAPDLAAVADDGMWSHSERRTRAPAILE
jgi:hypothetical protein